MFVLLLPILCTLGKKAAPSLVVPVSDHKEWKKLLRTKTNVLVAFTGEAGYGETRKKLAVELSQASMHGTLSWAYKVSLLF